MSCAILVKLILSLLLHLLEILRLVTGQVVKSCCIYPEAAVWKDPERALESFQLQFP